MIIETELGAAQHVAAEAPLIGALTGLVAGIYPAWRAARTEPLEALRR